MYRRRTTLKTKFLVTLGMFTLGAISASADTVSEQLVNNYKSTIGLYSPAPTVGSANGARNFYPLGTGLSGSPTQLTIKIEEDQGFAGGMTVYLVEYTGSASTTANGNRALFSYDFPANYPATATTSPVTGYAGSWSAGFSLDPSKYYGLLFSTSASQIGRLYGTNSGSFGWECAPQGGFTCDTSFKAPYYILSTGSSTIFASTQFTSYTPTLGEVTPIATSTTFTFGATGYILTTDFFEDDTVLYIRYKQSTGMCLRGNSCIGTSGEIEIPISSSGLFNLSDSSSEVLNTGVYNVYYAIRVPRYQVLGYGILTKTLIDSIGTFIVGEATDTEIQENQLLMNNSGFLSDATFIPTEETATSTLLGLTNAFGIRDAILQKFPFNWFIESSDIFLSMEDSTTTTEYSDVTIDYSSLHFLNQIATTSTVNAQVTFFASTTFDDVGDLAGIQLMRTLVSWTLWIGLLGYAWRATAGMFKSKAT